MRAGWADRAETGGARSASAARAWGRCRVGGGGGCEGAQVTAGGHRKEAHPLSTPRATWAALWTCPQSPRLDLPPGLGVVWRRGPNRPPPPVSPAPTCAHPASARAHSASCLPAAIKAANEKDELCTTPGCVMAGKPRPHLPWPCPGAGLPRRWAGPETGGGREGQDGGTGLPRWTRMGAAPRRGPGQWPRGFGAGGPAENEALQRLEEAGSGPGSPCPYPASLPCLLRPLSSLDPGALVCIYIGKKATQMHTRSHVLSQGFLLNYLYI